LARNFYCATFFGQIFNRNNLTFIKARAVAAAPASENTRLRTLFKKNKKTDWLFLILK
jgi:hypothetical protein